MKSVGEKPMDNDPFDPQTIGINADYPRLLQVQEQRRRTADKVLLRRMIDPPHAHASSRRDR